jgi:hypothetical protein
MMPQDGLKKNQSLQEIVPSDMEEVASFIGRESSSKMTGAAAVDRLSWILLENPARERGDPLGWLLRSSSGDIAGCMCCAPQKFCDGQTTFRLAMANSFYVSDEYRGAGTSIFLKYLQLGRRFPLFVSSANTVVAGIWHRLGAYPLARSDHEMLGIVNWKPALEEAVYRKTSSEPIARLSSAFVASFFRARRLSSSPGGELLSLTSADEAAKLCAEHKSDKITNCRDAAFLKWRYFSRPEPLTRLFAFSSADGNNQRFMVAINFQTRGYKQQVKALHVLDIWGEPSTETLLAIISSLWREYRERIDLFVFRCLNPMQEQVLQSVGFKSRSFAAPIAWCIDKPGLLPSKQWYFVPADGDMFL